ncbi:hypothetical protein N4T77_02860 [Clostridium sp. CX1]|uniref:hypothetical protein n=1 Tax=Clostridium sp. CX1 TaxID=2978346 RepID=UPI0021BF37FC|nr:hypothetical protein [Clostridium sp. CX1]MCT8975532.1 hypothetical protein [Clostridium sp. CX1]
MSKEEIAKELTLAAINNKLITVNTSKFDSYVEYSEKVAENVAAFYNKLMEQLDVRE